MGTWNYTPLGNDDAAGLKADFEESKDITILTDALNTVCALKDSEYLEAPEAQEAIAVAQILSSFDNNDYKELVQKALTRILKESELKELWEESDEYNEWVKSVEDLIK